MEKDDSKGNAPQKESIGDVLKKYKEGTSGSPVQAVPAPPTAAANVPSVGFNQEAIEKAMSQETDPDLMTSYEIVKLPSQGLFYANKISEVNVEYMT